MTAADGVGKQTAPEERDAGRSTSTNSDGGGGWPCRDG